MRMTDRQVLETKKKFEALLTVASCMDCDDHPDEKLDGFCSEAHRAEGYANIIVGLSDELLRYKALAKKHELPEPTEDEASTGVETDEDRDKRLLKRFENLKTAMEAIREEHETQTDGSYHRCGCDLCSAHRLMEEPNKALVRMAADYDAIATEYEALCQSFDEGVANGDRIRLDLHRVIGFTTKSPFEMAKLVYEAVRVALKDPKFKALYDEKRADSRRRALESIKTSQAMAQLTEDFEKLTSELEAVEAMVQRNPKSIDPSVVKEMREKASVISAKMAQTRSE